jgi:hypothetical protein
LVSLLDEINRFVAKRVGQNIIKTLLGTQDTMDRIQDFYVRFNGVFQAFQVRNLYSKASGSNIINSQISSTLREQEWQAKQDVARQEDRRRLEADLDALPRNDARLMQALRTLHFHARPM